MEKICGIYRIINKLNGKCYIGQSKDIYRRYSDHFHTNGIIPIDKEMQEWGRDNFELEILDWCDPNDQERLDYLEQVYIDIYKADDPDYGYNVSRGGDLVSNNAINRNSKLSSEDIYDIRESYANHERKFDVYEKYKDKISVKGFDQIWRGKRRANIHNDVYTEENLKYYSKETSLGENGAFASFTDSEVLELRKRYVNETAREIYDSVKSKCGYQTLQQILWGRYYSHLPIYDKKKKIWINN